MKIPIGNTGLSIDLDVEQQFSLLRNKIVKDLYDGMKRSGKVMEGEIRDHVSKKYPGSEHWNPNKINSFEPDSVDVDVAGAVRNYWDVDIYPVDAPSLVFPTEDGREKYGLKEWKDIYSILPNHNWFQPKGHDVICAMLNGSLVALFHLRDHVFQAQDPSLLPSDDTLCGAICAELQK